MSSALSGRIYQGRLDDLLGALEHSPSVRLQGWSRFSASIYFTEAAESKTGYFLNALMSEYRSSIPSSELPALPHAIYGHELHRSMSRSNRPTAISEDCKADGPGTTMSAACHCPSFSQPASPRQAQYSCQAACNNGRDSSSSVVLASSTIRKHKR
ncbi:hypothetical protein EJ06DRAFT_149407 [Trichodelitschia bisporula]|uniref:Uncharacterized protein n=1 Tax=Trichodelitschia bisporula TaxID=703511 RepID=A0A6G1HN70_9PEZI|nr:hypothetical protein EJ06DRAFT_149407 [Trichodelitschia bisporula]